MMNNRNYISYSDLKTSTFSKNLLALSALHESLVEQLKTEQIHQNIHLFQDIQNFINAEYFVNRKFSKFYNKAPKFQIPVFYDEWLNIQKPALLFGIGLGYGLKYLLDRSTIPELYVYERDKSLLKLALTLNDYASQILTERLIFIPQEEISTLVDKGIEHILPEPLLFRQNKVEYLTVSRIIKSNKLSCNRAVFFSGTLFILDCATTLFDQGWDVFEINPAILSTDKVHFLLDALDPDILFQINLQNDIKKFSSNRVVIEWEIDPMASPIPVNDSSANGKHFIFTHNPERLILFKERGYSHCEYLPLCTNPLKFSTSRHDVDFQPRYRCDVSFVGSLMYKSHRDLLGLLLETLQKLSQVENPNWGEIHNWLLRLIANPPGGSKNVRLLDELKNLLNVFELPDSIKINDSYLLITAPVAEFLAYLWRKQVITALVPLGIHLWGKEEWKTEFPHNYQGKADHYLDIPRIYFSSKINLDISRITQPNIITMRVFDVLACRGFVLADRNEALLELFTEDENIVCYDTTEEALDKIHYYLKNENARLKIARKGYETVMQAHTFKHRINHILDKTLSIDNIVQSQFVII